MAGDAAGECPRYWGFISYSHKDAAFGRSLHRRLESYLLPRRLVGRATTQGTVPRRIVPVFRDREELPAANDLSAEVRAALAQSRSLVVVCSPEAAASPWVSREVELFRTLHPERPILAAIREGEPSQCFPQALVRPAADGECIEPLAADFRAGHDGRHLGLLKLVAGIAGVGLDELAQRDAQRNRQRVTAVTAAALAGMLAMGALTAFALNARAEALRQRGEAEGLVEFMLTDLRDRLKGVGRLDVMTAVNERALHYYSDQNLDSLPVDSLERRARILHAMGEDDEARGDHDAALKKFREASRTTGVLLAAAPNDPERIFDQAQSEFWIGDVDYEEHKSPAAQSAFLKYKRLADKLVTISPENAKYRREAAYADGNMCSLALRTPADPKSAVLWCKLALREMEQASRHLAPSNGIQDDLINRHAWMADAYVAANNIASARTERLKEERILAGELANDPENMDRKSTWIALQISLALFDERDRRMTSARNRLNHTMSTLESMIKFDHRNKKWQSQRTWIRSELSKLN